MQDHFMNTFCEIKSDTARAGGCRVGASDVADTTVGMYRASFVATAVRLARG